MEVIVLQVFVSLMLVLGSLILFAYSAKQRDAEHADRLCLLPIEDDAEPAHSDAEPAQTTSRWAGNATRPESPTQGKVGHESRA